MISIYSICCFPIGFMRDDKNFGFHLPTLPWRYQSRLKPSTFSEGENIEIYLVQFSAQKSLGAAAQTWRLERKKSCNIFFFASSLRLFFFFQRDMIYSFLRNGLCFRFARIYGTIWTEKLLIQAFTVFIFQFLALTCIFLRKCLFLVHFCGDVLG